MSRRSSNNVRVEGFFGTLKSEFFYSRDWRGVAAEEFMAELDARLRWFRSGGISQALGWLTPDEHRLACGYVVAWWRGSRCTGNRPQFRVRCQNLCSCAWAAKNVVRACRSFSTPARAGSPFLAVGLCVLLSLAIKNGDKVCKVLRGKNVMLQTTVVGNA